MAQILSSAFDEEQAKFEYLQFVVPDQHCLARGKVVKGKFKTRFARDGFQCGNSICALGPNSELSMSVFDILGQNFPNEEMRPCLDTLTPWPWASRPGRRLGSVLCDLYMADGRPDLTSPRQLMKAQLDTLWDRHGLVLKSAFEYEFGVYKADSLQPLGGDRRWCWNMRAWADHRDLFCDLTEVLEDMGVEVSSLMPEYPPGQWEMTTDPEVGVRGGDVAFYVKNAVKGFFPTQGYTATFMSKPTAGNMASGMHLNHSLWRPAEGGDVGKGADSAMLEQEDPSKMSQTARHWLAGLLTHAPALSALCSPTLNCYRRLHSLGTPSTASWGVDDRSAAFRLLNARDNVYVENRLVSGASCPYLAIAATVAAGLDGLDRQLDLCPLVNHGQETGTSASDQAAPLPTSLAQALDALEGDARLRALLGDRFVQVYLKAKREYEVGRYQAAGLATEALQLQFERDMYFDSL